MTDRSLGGVRQLQEDIFNSLSLGQDFSFGFRRNLAKRISQLFETPLGSVVPQVLAATELPNSFIPLCYKGISFSSRNFSFLVSRRVKIRLWSQLMFKVFLVQLAILWPFRKRFQKVMKFTFLFSLTATQISHAKSLRGLSEFLNEPRFGLNSELDLILVEGQIALLSRRSWKRLKVTRSIPLYIARNFFSCRIRGRLILQSFSIIFAIRYWAKSNPIILIGAFALIEESIYNQFLREYPRTTLITTPSQLTIQSIAFDIYSDNELVRKIMLWYSSIGIPITYTGIHAPLIDESIYSCASLNEQWVWTESHGKYLENINHVPFVVKGSMLFYPKSSVSIARRSRTKRIIIFDTTPIDLAQPTEYLYSTENMHQFIDDIVKTVSTLESVTKSNIEIFLKPKRETHKIHAQSYLSLLAKYAATGRIILVSPSESIYDLIRSAHAVISIPATSPAIIAKEEGVASCYYTGMREVELPVTWESMPVIRSPKKLSDFLEHSLELS